MAVDPIISIHAPLAGRDLPPLLVEILIKSFQSTRPSRGATGAAFQSESRGVISIHAPLAGRDGHRQAAATGNLQFQSTRPSRGATRRIDNILFTADDFNPRAPRGARLVELQV